MATPVEAPRQGERIWIPPGALLTTKYLLAKFPKLEVEDEGIIGVLEGITLRRRGEINFARYAVRVEVGRVIGETRIILGCPGRREDWKIDETYSDAIVVRQESIEIDQTMLNEEVETFRLSDPYHPTIVAEIFFRQNLHRRVTKLGDFQFRQFADIDRERSRAWPSGNGMLEKVISVYLEIQDIINNLHSPVVAQELAESRIKHPVQRDLRNIRLY